MSTEPKEPQKDDNRGSERLPRPPVRTLLFWVVILFGMPAALYFLRHPGDARTKELSQSAFETLLESGAIKEVTVVRTPSGVDKLQGKYKPEHDDRDDLPFTVDVVYSETLDNMVRSYCDVRTAEPQSTMLSTILVSVLPLLLLVGIVYYLFSRQLKMAGRGAMQFGKSRARMTTPNQERVTFDDVCGITEAKEEMEEIVEYLKDPKKFQRLGGRIPKGVLMMGPPGTGKTLLARAIAGEAEVPFFSISGSDFVEMFVGVGASRVRDMFEEGKRHAPCIVFIDEIDAVGRSRFSGIGGGHDEREQTLNALLVEMDGFEANSGVIVVAATNRPDVLDEALLRPGRFDRQIAIDLPDLRGRWGILKLHASKVELAEGVRLEVIARGTPGFSGADLANLINEAALLAARGNKKAVELDDLEEARDKVRWGKERRSRKIDEEERKLTAYHEAGHALVGIMSDKATPLHKITIIPRGVAYLGATMHLPEEDRYTRNRAELHDQLAMLMGGRVAERLVFEEITNGGSSDILQATGLAKKMVCQWGMSDKMGPLSYSGGEQHIFLGRDITRGDDFSPETAREIDQEIRRFVHEAEERATDILGREIDRLKLLAETLLEQETMDAEDVYHLLGLEYKAPAEIEIEEEGKGDKTDSEEGESEGTDESSPAEMQDPSTGEAGGKPEQTDDMEEAQPQESSPEKDSPTAPEEKSKPADPAQ